MIIADATTCLEVSGRGGGAAGASRQGTCHERLVLISSHAAPCLCSFCSVQAVMIIADATTCLEVSGKGELLEPADGVHAIGSGSRFAVAAARALMGTALPPLEIAQRAMAISAARCVYSNLFLWVWGGWRVLLSE